MVFIVINAPGNNKVLQKMSLVGLAIVKKSDSVLLEQNILMNKYQ
jgi:hypothetical protein